MWKTLACPLGPSSAHIISSQLDYNKKNPSCGWAKILNLAHLLFVFFGQIWNDHGEEIGAVSSCSNIADTGVVLLLLLLQLHSQPQASFSSVLGHTVTSSCPSFVSHFHYFWICDDRQEQAPPLWLLAKISHKVIILFVVPVKSSAAPKIHTIAELWVRPWPKQQGGAALNTAPDTTVAGGGVGGGGKNRLARSPKLTFSECERLSPRPPAAY